MTLAELKIRLDQAQAAYDTATIARNEASQALRSITGQLGQAEKAGDVETVLSLQTEVVAARQRLALCEQTLQAAKGRLAMADKYHTNAHNTILSLDNELSALSARLGPGGYYDQQIKAIQKQLSIFQAGKAQEEAKLTQLQEKCLALVGSDEPIGDNPPNLAVAPLGRRSIFGILKI